MANIYRDDDADLGWISDEAIAVVGYGNQGRSQALNLRDSGLRVVVGCNRDETHQQALSDGFEVVPIERACESADVVMLLVPDEVMPELYAERVAPNLRAGAAVVFASGYNVAFGLIELRRDLDVVLVAPRMIGAGVRDCYVNGAGFPSIVGVHQDATGRAQKRMLGLAKALGSTRVGCLELSMHEEASIDLFMEQGFGPAFGRVLMTAADVLVEAGFPPEAVILELYLSGELAYTFEKIREMGITKQLELHSRTSQYGIFTRGLRFLELGGPIKEKMCDVLDEIRSGRFAEEWTSQQEDATDLLQRVRAAQEKLPLAEWERRARQAFRIGAASEADAGGS